MQPNPRANIPPPRGLQLFRPPYQSCESLDLGWRPGRPEPGAAAVWFMSPASQVYTELEWLWERPASLPFFIVLPEPEDIPPLASVLRSVPELRPRGVLPSVTTGTMGALRVLLAAPPRLLAPAVVDLLSSMGRVPDQEARERIRIIFASAAHTGSIDQLATALCQSRRTLGRFFATRNLPVPSHWLQFARILHVAIQLQNTQTNINRVSGRFGYPDGFTMSNSMKRLTGYRPSFVREHLGWEWLVEAWLREENAS
jgi:AraC-like DNA-binding protein